MQVVNHLRHAVAAVVYVSEGSNAGILGSLRGVAEDAAAQACGVQTSSKAAAPGGGGVPGATLLHVFSDPHYNRSSFVLAGASPQAVAATALELTSAALAALPDLREHDATHPRIGIVDHISFAPLCPPPEAEASEGSWAASAASAETQAPGDEQPHYANVGVNMDDAADAALSLSNSLAEKLDLPVMLYGAARRAPLEPRTLAETRRQTPYFRGKAKNSGVAETAAAAAAGEGDDDIWKAVTPDLGGPVVDPRRGVCCCGAVPLVLNYNVRLATEDRAVAAAATRAVRSRGGGGGAMPSSGLPFVEALPLVHENGNFEVACNLLDPSVTPPQAVLERIASVAMDQFGVAVDDHYTIGMTTDEMRRRLVAAATLEQ